MAIIKNADIVALHYCKSGIDPNQPIPQVIKYRWHGDEFHLTPGKSIKLPREGAMHIIGMVKNTQQNKDYKNPTATVNIKLEIKELVIREEEAPSSNK